MSRESHEWTARNPDIGPLRRHGVLRDSARSGWRSRGQNSALSRHRGSRERLPSFRRSLVRLPRARLLTGVMEIGHVIISDDCRSVRRTGTRMRSFGRPRAIEPACTLKPRLAKDFNTTRARMEPRTESMSVPLWRTHPSPVLAGRSHSRGPLLRTARRCRRPVPPSAARRGANGRPRGSAAPREVDRSRTIPRFVDDDRRTIDDASTSAGRVRLLRVSNMFVRDARSVPPEITSCPSASSRARGSRGVVEEYAEIVAGGSTSRRGRHTSRADDACPAHSDRSLTAPSLRPSAASRRIVAALSILRPRSSGVPIPVGLVRGAPTTSPMMRHRHQV